MIKKSGIYSAFKKCVALTLTIAITSTTYVMAEDIYIPYDRLIFNDTVAAAYTGFENGNTLISNLSFADTVNHTYGEEITRLGALDVVKGGGSNYRPNSNVTNIEALISIIRMQGLESEALARVDALGNNFPTLSNYELVQLGFIDIAVQNGYLTNQQRTQAQLLDQSVINPETGFIKDDPATKEQLAFWIGHLLTFIGPDALDKQTVQSVNQFSDFNNINSSYLDEVEDVVSLGIINATGTFNPLSNVTRGEFSSYLANIDKIYLDHRLLIKKTGFVGGIKVHQENNADDKLSLKDFYIRDNDGKVDIIRNYLNSDNVVQTFNLNTPVYKNGKVNPITILEEGDTVEYIVDEVTDKVYYINVTSSNVVTTSEGRIYNIDFTNKTITLKMDRQNSQNYPLSESLIVDNSIIFLIDGFHQKINKAEVPEGSLVKVSVRNGVVYEIEYVGDVIVDAEVQGVVLENNSEFGYLRLYTSKKTIQVYNYYDNEIIVEKQGFYGSDSVGYYDEMFESNLYDSRDTTIDQVEAGDLVFLKTNKDDPTVIDSISASTNYIMRYGKVVSSVDNGEYFNLMVEYDNGVTSMFNVSSDIIILKEGKMVQPYEIHNGDYLKFLVNYAVLSPGVYMETVKEIILEGEARLISTIYKGDFGGVDLAQETISLRNAMDLTSTSWANYSQLEKLSVRKNLEIYHNDKQVNLDYLNRYLKNSDAVTYVAVEKSFGGDVVKKISIYDGRDNLLEKDFVSTSTGTTLSLSDGVTSYNILNSSIIVKDGRLVDGNSVLASDYVHISANKDTAAVINIEDPINNETITLQRGRVYSVDEGESFKVSSMSMYLNGDWQYSPVEREYLINYDTIILNPAGGVVAYEDLRDFSTSTSYDKAYNIFSDGTDVVLIAEQPYLQDEIKGTIYDIQGTVVYLKDATYLDRDTNTWKSVSYENNYVAVALAQNNVVVKDSQIIDISKVNEGEEIRFLTNSVGEEVTSGQSITAYIGYVEE
ncbi:MAG: S-layer homology domain-containing protein [Lachnospirales bacterium]